MVVVSEHEHERIVDEAAKWSTYLTHPSGKECKAGTQNMNPDQARRQNGGCQFSFPLGVQDSRECW